MANELAVKIARIMGRLDRLPKTGWNKHFSYPFVTDADVADAVRRELASENIAFFASMTGCTKEGKHTTATFEYTFMCGDSGEKMVLMWTGEANDGQDKGLSKAATSAEKYFLLKTFMLSTGDKQDDPDSGNEDRDEQPASRPQPRQDAQKKGHDHGASLTGEMSTATFGGEDDPRADNYHRDQKENGDDFPTIRSVWPDMPAGLLLDKIADLDEGFPLGAAVYKEVHKLGYANADAVKAALQLGSITEWQGTLRALLDRIIELAEKGE
jgi:hypothetical protein